MGSSQGAVKEGRYEKDGGKEVGAFFEESRDNEKIKAVYGNYGFWAWLRYWWLDTENQIALWLADKSYYDYDYTPAKPQKKVRPEDVEIWSSEKLAQCLSSLIDPTTGKSVFPPAERAANLQKIIRRDKGLQT